MSATTPAAATPAQNPVKKPTLALAFLGVLGAIQGSDPNIASTALVGAARQPMPNPAGGPASDPIV